MTEAAIDHAGAEFSARLRLEAKDPADVNLARAYLASREELAISKSNAVGFSDQFDVANKRAVSAERRVAELEAKLAAQPKLLEWQEARLASAESWPFRALAIADGYGKNPVTAMYYGAVEGWMRGRDRLDHVRYYLNLSALPPVPAPTKGESDG